MAQVRCEPRIDQTELEDHLLSTRHWEPAQHCLMGPHCRRPHARVNLRHSTRDLAWRI